VIRLPLYTAASSFQVGTTNAGSHLVPQTTVSEPLLRLVRSLAQFSARETTNSLCTVPVSSGSVAAGWRLR
jgi:hypothetical protein